MRRWLALVMAVLCIMALPTASAEPGTANIADYEAGNTSTVAGSEWSVSAGGGTYQAQSQTTLTGNFSGELIASNDNRAGVSFVRSSDTTVKRITTELQVSTTPSTGDPIKFQLTDSGGNIVGTFTLKPNGDVVAGGSTVATWQSGQTYRVGFKNIDYTNSQYDVVFDGTVVATDVSMTTSVGDLNQLDIINNGADTKDVSLILDDVRTEATLPTSAPAFDSSTASPTGNLQQPPQSLSINVSDGDFPSGYVDVTARQDGSKVGAKRVWSNGTVSFSIPSPSAGQHTYNFTAVDEEGNSVTTKDFSYKVPDQLVVRSEPNPQALVDSATVKIRVYETSGQQREVYTRSTTTGKLDLTGLPADQPLVISADASGYRPRRIFITSLYQQQTVYLLNDTAQATTTTFAISDYTGNYPQQTSVLEVEREINGEFKTVLGDYFGANGEFSAQLAYNTRHRLVLRNTKTGQKTILGPFTPLTDGTETVDVFASGDIAVQRTSPLVSVSPSTTALPAIKGQTIEAEISPRDATIDTATVEIYHRDSNGQLTLLASQTVQQATTVTKTVNLSNRNGSVIVKTDLTTADGSNTVAYRNISLRQQISNQYSLLSALLSFNGLIPGPGLNAFQSAVAIITAVVAPATAASQTRLSGEAFAMIAVAVLAGWAVIGWVGYGLVFAVGVGTAGIVILRRGV